jgi:hypothetical protein
MLIRDLPEDVLIVPVGSLSIYWRDIPTWMDTVAYRTETVMVPISFAARALSMYVHWCEESRTATIIDLQGRVIIITADSYVMYIDGRPVLIIGADGLPKAAEIHDSRIFVPKETVATALGLLLYWSEERQTAYYWKWPHDIPHHDSALRIPIGMPVLWRDYVTYTMDTQVFINETGSVMVPASFAARAVGLNVHWNEETFTATITDQAGTSLIIVSGQYTATLGGIQVTITGTNGAPVRALIRDSRIFVPMETIEKTFGLTADWREGVAVLPLPLTEPRVTF